MNVSRSISFLFALLSACIQEAPQASPPPDEEEEVETVPPATDTESDDNDGAAYAYSAGELVIHRNYNPYVGARIGLFADGAGVIDGWNNAVATVAQSEEGDLTVNLALFGNGQSVRWALATLDDDNAPDDWLWESGVIAENLVDGDSLGLTLWVEECDVQKLNFCTRIIGDDVVLGECALTNVDPPDCDDVDNDGDVDPDTDPDPDTDTGGDTGTDCDDVDNDGDTYSECEGDCDDGYRYTYPGAPEYYDGADQDCDGTADDGCESDDAWNGFCD